MVALDMVVEIRAWRRADVYLHVERLQKAQKPSRKVLTTGAADVHDIQDFDEVLLFATGRDRNRHDIFMVELYTFATV